MQTKRVRVGEWSGALLVVHRSSGSISAHRHLFSNLSTADDEALSA